MSKSPIEAFILLPKLAIFLGTPLRGSHWIYTQHIMYIIHKYLFYLQQWLRRCSRGPHIHTRTRHRLRDWPRRLHGFSTSSRPGPDNDLHLRLHIGTPTTALHCPQRIPLNQEYLCWLFCWLRFTVPFPVFLTNFPQIQDLEKHKCLMKHQEGYLDRRIFPKGTDVLRLQFRGFFSIRLVQK